jgi:hydroxyethylthiazole kinase
MSNGLSTSSAWRSASADLLGLVQRDAPLVQCITNYVAMNFAANVLLAVGASPAMVHAQEESAEFAGFCSALTINIGTLSASWLDGMRTAAQAAGKAGTPWVLDPVAHQATAFRRRAIRELLDLNPTIIRGNASEIITLAGGTSASMGVDAKDSVVLAESSATALAHRQQAVVAVTGEIDFVTDGRNAVRIGGGSALMPRVTAMGCALTGVVGAFAGVAPGQPLLATVAALSCFGVAGEAAGTQAVGPGSFAWRFIDALAGLTPTSIHDNARLEPV